MPARIAILLSLAFWGILLAAQDTPTAPDSTSTPTSQTPQSPPPPARKIKSYHDGSIRDLEAVGNRNIGCSRGIGNWYSLESQIATGRAYSQQVERTAKVIRDPVIVEYVNRIGQNTGQTPDTQVPFTIKVIDSDEVNAFALPGGFFYVDTGLILAADKKRNWLE